MAKSGFRQKGVVLIIVLLTILIVIILSNVLLSIINSQSRLTGHQLGRIQAYYAAMAGINYAYDKLRKGDVNWPTPAANSSYQRTMCRGCIPPPNIDEPNLPKSINNVVIQVSGVGAALPGGGNCVPPSGGKVCISATTDYTFTPS